MPWRIRPTGREAETTASDDNQQFRQVMNSQLRRKFMRESKVQKAPPSRQLQDVHLGYTMPITITILQYTTFIPRQSGYLNYNNDLERVSNGWLIPEIDSILVPGKDEEFGQWTEVSWRRKYSLVKWAEEENIRGEKNILNSCWKHNYSSTKEYAAFLVSIFSFTRSRVYRF